MSGRLNHRGWIVLESIASTDGGLCVDFFQADDGTFGFAHFRADPEDAGRWTPIGTTGGQRFDDPTLAAMASTEAVAWLLAERGPRTAWQAWLDHLGLHRA